MVCRRQNAQQPELWASLEINTSLDHRFQHWTLKFEMTVFLFFIFKTFFVCLFLLIYLAAF